MTKSEVLEMLEETYGTSNPQEVDEHKRWILYENIKSNIRSNGDPDQYTKQIIIISDALEL